MTHIAAFALGVIASSLALIVALGVKYRSDTSSTRQKGHTRHSVGQASVFRRATRFGRLERIVGVQGWK